MIKIKRIINSDYFLYFCAALACYYMITPLYMMENFVLSEYSQIWKFHSNFYNMLLLVSAFILGCLISFVGSIPYLLLNNKKCKTVLSLVFLTGLSSLCFYVIGIIIGYFAINYKPILLSDFISIFPAIGSIVGIGLFIIKKHGMI